MKPTPRVYLKLSQLNWFWVVGGFAVIFICLFFYQQLDYVANGEHRSPLLTFGEEGIGTLAGLLVFPLAYVVAVRFPVISERWRRNLLVHLAAVCLISIVHTSIIVLLRSIFMRQDNYGYVPVRYPMEFAHFFIFYWVGVSLISLFHEVRFAREREFQQARLEASLSEAQLQNLRLQLEPHFLFNALNAISAALYEDPRVADQMICRLGELLRHLLKQDRSQLVPLAREMEALELYIGIMKARLEDRLDVVIEIDEPAKNALIPQLLLQPLIENAIRHGMDELTFRVRLFITIRSCGNQLAMEVRDGGPGFPLTSAPGTDGHGIGLRNTIERLSRIYGSRASLSFANASGGGAKVSLAIPFETIPLAEQQAGLETVSA